MLANYHTHTTFCDGKNSPEEVILSAIAKGFSAIGFSGHGYTAYDLRYCMKDTEAFKQAIPPLKEKYKNQIQVYMGTEEDAFAPVNRSDYEYMIGSCHYFRIDRYQASHCGSDALTDAAQSQERADTSRYAYYPIDSGYGYFKKCLALFDNDPIRLADAYYGAFVPYILKRKPDIIGHFDLITKFDEKDTDMFLRNAEYEALAEKYTKEALKADCIFEVNTGAISRGYRQTPYPSEQRLHVLKREGGKVMLSSDSHAADTIDCSFAETRKRLKDIGFQYVYVLYDGEFQKDYI